MHRRQAKMSIPVYITVHYLSFDSVTKGRVRGTGRRPPTNDLYRAGSSTPITKKTMIFICQLGNDFFHTRYTREVESLSRHWVMISTPVRNVSVGSENIPVPVLDASEGYPNSHEYHFRNPEIPGCAEV